MSRPEGKRAVNIVGAGLAGSEAAWQLANRGIDVTIHEMRPAQLTPAHKTGECAELVCSNSLGSLLEQTASGLLKREMAKFGSLVVDCALQSAVPAGNALGVDRLRFSELMSSRLRNHSLISWRETEVQTLETDVPTLVATGPLTSQPLARAIAELIDEKFLYFYDAISPMIELDSIDLTPLFWGSRYEEDLDYLNIPLSKAQYHALIDDLLGAEKVPLHAFEEEKFFESCLPMDVVAARGRETLAHGPLKPVGLINPHSSQRPHAVIQLRRENMPTTMVSMVGCQNKLKWPEQERIFRRLPGLANARFLRLGSVHRNTYIHSPHLLRSDLSLKGHDHLFFAGQVSGVEGYLESAATGLVAGLALAARLQRRPWTALPTETMLGALVHYVSHGPPPTMGRGDFQPMNSNFGLLPPIEAQQRGRKGRSARRQLMVQRALDELDHWMNAHPWSTNERSTAIQIPEPERLHVNV